MNHTTVRIGIIVILCSVYVLVTWYFPSTQLFIGGFFAGWVIQGWAKHIADAWIG